MKGAKKKKFNPLDMPIVKLNLKEVQMAKKKVTKKKSKK